jgi:fibronectin-binding autotransporter adhesin
MNKIFNIVWCKALRQLVVTSELSRRSAGGSATRSSRSLRAPVLALTALAAALFFAMPAQADAGLAMPGGAILDINNGTAPNSASNTPDTFQTYSVTFTATTSGNNYILFAFREDPAFWTFGNVSLYAAADTSTNLFTNPLFTQGGTIDGTSGVQAPANWGVVYQSGTTPTAAGTWHEPGDGDQSTTNVNANGAGSWYDGAVGSFDGIYQGVDLVAGITYTINFTALANDSADTAGTGSDTEMGVYAGTCITLTGPAANCAPSNPDFSVLATPGDAANAGGPSVIPITTTTTVTDLGTTNGAFDGGTLVVDQNNTTASQDFTVSGNGGVIDQNGNQSTFTGVISDEAAGTPGSITVTNSGTGGSVTLTGENTYTGHTSIDSGATLALAGGGSIASSDGVTDNGTFDINQANGDEAIATLAGNGAVVLGGNDLDITNGHDTFSGSIEGTGGVNVSGGTQTFTGTSTYSGGTTVTDGATVSINNGNALGTGTIALGDGTLNTSADASLANVIDVTGTGTVNTDANTSLSHTGAVSGSGDFIKDGEGTLLQSGTLDQAGATIVNDGTLVLSGNNTYTGGTVFNGGTTEVSSDANLGAASGALTFDGGALVATSSMTSSRDVDLDGTGTVAASAGQTLTLAGTVSGAGNLGVVGGTVVLGGSNTYSGGTTVDNGATASIMNTQALGTGTVTLADGTLATDVTGSVANNIVVAGTGKVDTTSSTTVTHTGTVTGTGDFIKNGAGTLQQSGTMDQAGATIVNDGTLVLSGNNGYTGGTVLNGGTTEVSSDANLGGATGDITFNGGALVATSSMTSSRDVNLDGVGTVAADAGQTLTLAGTVSGAGGLAVAGGTVVLNGANTYGEGTLVTQQGTLQIANDGNLGAASAGIALDNGTLHTTGDVDSARNIDISAAGGTIVTDAGTTYTSSAGTTGAGALTKAGGGTLQIDGNVTTSGGVAVSDGTLVLNGNNSYTGSTVVSDGATLQIDSGAALGAALGNGLIIADSTLRTTGDVDTSKQIGMIGGATFDIGADTTMTSHGQIAGQGPLVKAGGGTLVLDDANDYMGDTRIDNGTLQIASDTALGQGGSLIFNGGALHTTGDVVSSRDVLLDADASIETDAGTSTLFGGPISGGGALIKDGAGVLQVDGVASHTGGTTVNDGTLVLTANNTYTGGNTLNGGTLQISSDANLGDASNGIDFDGGVLHTTDSFSTARDLSLNTSGTIATDAGTTVVATGSISGNAGLVKDGAGTLDISGVASHVGGTTVNDGTLILGGNNTYTGGNTLNGGTLQVSSDANLGAASNGIAFNGGNLTVTQSMTTDRDISIGAKGANITTLDGVTLNEQGDMSGTGGLVKLGGGTLVVSGNNTFTGGTLIQGGVIRIDSGSSLGTGAILLQGGMLQTVATLGTGQQVIISGDSGVNVDAGTTTVLSGSLVAAAGDACFTKTGKGKLSLTGSATMASGTCVQDGILSANGYLDSSFVQVDTIATLRGTGTIVGPVNVAGLLAPGNSPGTLTVQGPVTMQAGSTLEIDIDGQGTANGAGNYSRVLVAGVGNQFVANGTLAPTLRGITGDASNTYTPTIGSMYRIVTADGGVVGQFATLAQPTSGLAAGTRFLAFYRTNEGHSIDLTVAPTSYAGYLSASAKRNDLAAATALDGSVLALDAGTATAAQTSLLYAVSPLSGDRLAAMAKSLSGEVHADEAAAARAAGLGMQRDIADHLGTDVQAADAAHKVWANVTQDGNKSVADGQGSGFQTDTSRTTAGIDLYAESGTVLGVAATNHDTSVIAQAGSGSIRGNSGMLYAQQAIGAFLLDGVAAYGSSDWTTRRADPLGGTTLESRASGKDAMASATLRLPMQTAGGNRIEPYASVIWQKVERDGTTERGASAAALSLDELSQKGTRVLAGVTMGSKAADPLATTLTWRAGIAAGVDTGSLLDPTVRNTLAAQGFNTAAPGVGRGFVQINANGTMRLGKSTYLYGGLTAEEGQRRSAYGVTAGVRVAI